MRRPLRHLGAAGVVAAAAAATRLTRYEIAEDSMAPALRAGDWVIGVRDPRRPKRGHIVVFAHPQRPEFEVVKRVVGLPGETVVVAAGRVRIGDRLLDEPWARGATQPGGSWSVPPGTVFLLGDNREAGTSDGRTLGPTPVASLRARLFFRYHPGRPGPVR